MKNVKSDKLYKHTNTKEKYTEEDISDMTTLVSDTIDKNLSRRGTKHLDQFNLSSKLYNYNPIFIV